MPYVLFKAINAQDSLTKHCGNLLRFGNRVSNPLSQAAFVADGTGPGRLTAAIVQCSDAELAVNYSADVAGRYSLAIRCRSTGEVRSRINLTFVHAQ
jgi:hypothetical protein